MKFQLIPDILYHVLYFEFTQNYGYSLNQKQPSIYPYFYSPQSTFLFAQP